MAREMAIAALRRQLIAVLSASYLNDPVGESTPHAIFDERSGNIAQRFPVRPGIEQILQIGMHFRQ
ncbi:MAG TPA: hypothetical protein VGM07_15025 [Stellaceae bacterium]